MIDDVSHLFISDLFSSQEISGNESFVMYEFFLVFFVSSTIVPYS